MSVLEYNEVRWTEVLKGVMADVALQYSSLPVSSHEEVTGAWNLLPRWIEAQNKSTPLKEVYDIGCGIGILGAFVASLNKESHVVALDVDPLNTNLTIRRKYGLYFDICDICQSAWMIDAATPNMVDAVIMADVLQYLRFSPVAVFKLLRKILKPEGVLYLSCPDAAGLYGKVYKNVTSYKEIPAYPGHTALNQVDYSEVFWNYSKQEVLEIAESVGFKASRFGYSATSKGAYLNFAFAK